MIKGAFFQPAEVFAKECMLVRLDEREVTKGTAISPTDFRVVTGPL